MNTHPNESGALQRLSKRETLLLSIRTHMIVIKELHWPILYRYIRKVTKWIGADL